MYYTSRLAMHLGPGLPPVNTYFGLKLGLLVGLVLAIVINCFSFAHTVGALRRTAFILGGCLTLLTPIWGIFVWVISNNTI